MGRALSCVVVAVAIGVGAAAAQEFSPGGPGLAYCPPPSQPACTGEDATFASELALADCTRAFNRYIDSVFGYRTCLERETKRAIAQANAASAVFKCRAAGRSKCP
jgi:hypothetical protein